MKATSAASDRSSVAIGGYYRGTIFVATLTALFATTLAFALLAQQPSTGPAKGKQAATAKEFPEDHRPPLFFRETWKNPLETDNAQEPRVRQDHMTNPNLELKLYGPDNKDI